MNDLTDQQVYSSFAEDYRSNKKTAMNSVLMCGKVLHDAKQKMTSLMFKHFLDDPRVGESERTAQRLITIYKNFRHILNKPDKLDVFSQLGVSHLLELKKLPDRFTKEIEVIVESDDGVSKEICKVIDEEKLADFLDDTVEVHGEFKKVRDLTASQMRKVVNEQAGIFEPEDPFSDSPKVEFKRPTPIPDINGAVSDSVEESPAPVSTENVADLLRHTDSFIVLFNELLGTLNVLSDSELSVASDRSLSTLRERCPKIISYAQAIVVKMNELQEKM